MPINHILFTLLLTLICLQAPAHALTVDFTNSAHFSSGDYSQTYTPFGGGSLTVGLLPADNSLTFQNFDGDATVNPNLAFDNDGIGIGDDEITVGDEEVTVTFSQTVSVLGFYFLDLFKSQNTTDEEVALVYNNGSLVGTFNADLQFQQQGGYRYAASPMQILADTLVFKADIGNDSVGKADYALAAIDVQPIPVPAALPLFGTALAGIGFFGWRRKRTARVSP